METQVRTEIRRAETREALDLVRQLFREYAESLNFDLCFQNFEEELADLPGRYGPPRGALLIAWRGEEAAGCVALRDLGDATCEMKRLWVRSKFRSMGIGRQLAEAVVKEGTALGYGRMRLDTVASMAEAIRLYRSLGFEAIPPYTHNPLPQALYFERPLDGGTTAVTSG